MKKMLAAAVAAAILIALAGCGGGGGTGGGSSLGGNNPPSPPVGDSNAIVGRVVSSQSGNPGVSGVLVTLGNTTVRAGTDAGGYFRLSVGSLSELPFYFQVDTTNAGATFPNGQSVTYRNQVYLPNDIDIPVDVINKNSYDLGTVTLTYVPIGDTPPPPGVYTDKDTILMGRVVRSDNGVGIQGVTVSFGTPAVTATTGNLGYFGLNLGRDPVILSLFPDPPYVFSVNTSTAGSSYPSTLQVSYEGATYAQNAILAPTQILSGESTDLGTLRVIIPSGGGGDEPPPPPGG